MANQHNLEHIFALPYLSVQNYLQTIKINSQGEREDRLNMTISLFNKGLLVLSDQKLIKQIDQFEQLYLLPDQELITLVQAKGKEIPNITNRFDLIRILLEKNIRTGKLYTFGINYYGQLGLGDNLNRNVPTLVSTIK